MFPACLTMTGWRRHRDHERQSKTLYPIALWGRSSLSYLHQSSSFSRASARLVSQWAFWHSDRTLPMKASMNPLSVGFPGREKSSVTFFAKSRRSRSRDVHSLSRTRSIRATLCAGVERHDFGRQRRSALRDPLPLGLRKRAGSLEDAFTRDLGLLECRCR